MTDLHVHGPVTHRVRWSPKAVQWVWPEAGHIHDRCELLALGHGGRMPRPNQWAAFMGLQCGLLCISLLECAAAAFGSLPAWQTGSALRLALILMAVTCSMAASYCGMRVDPALVRLHDLLEIPSRRTVGAIFYLTFSASALLLYLLPAFSGVSAVLPFSLLSLAVGLSAAQAFFGSCMAAESSREIPEDTSVSLRHPMLNTIPVLLIYVSIIICCSATASWAFGVGTVGSRAWLGVAILLLIRIVRGIGEEKMLTRWRPAIADSMRQIVSDGAVFVNRSRPSLAYTVLTAQVIEEADLTAEIPLEPILDSIAERLELCMNGQKGFSAEALASACRVLAVNGRSRPGLELMRMQCLPAAEYHRTRPTIRVRLCELVAGGALLEHTAMQDRLLTVVRARMWEALQLNPWNDVALLLDCYLAAVSLGERDSPRMSRAASTISEVATRVADELTKICDEQDESRNDACHAGHTP